MKFFVNAIVVFCFFFLGSTALAESYMTPEKSNSKKCVSYKKKAIKAKKITRKVRRAKMSKSKKARLIKKYLRKHQQFKSAAKKSCSPKIKKKQKESHDPYMDKYVDYAGA